MVSSLRNQWTPGWVAAPRWPRQAPASVRHGPMECTLSESR
ncbi:hypothetical protein CNE_1c10350 [Cupriavidus necator N-1]|uniref:Uncharacterized protein n=1 Tax=Cupriavidus necator (strain ATCC 43291 / DSM 13513 / CCUG 52238 / LMG 8453 / N-1) TaxID=1042878 RepID=G0F0A6_CUPNN|nr:hypothetical protein CNE_1c10350 [Cupriavidus necator N-1]KAI3596270.1 hypothetical protein D8I24_7464 [Cupriavidus necator H850]